MLTAFMAVLSGMIFWQIGGSDSSDQTVRESQPFDQTSCVVSFPVS
jgi:hypothetical protein